VGTSQLKQMSSFAKRARVKRSKVSKPVKSGSAKNEPMVPNNPRKVYPGSPQQDSPPGAVYGSKARKVAKRQMFPGAKEAMFNLAQPNQTVTVPIQSTPVQQCFAAAILGALQHPISMGFEDIAEQSSTSIVGAAFYAYVYLTQILFSYIANTTAMTIKVPQWLDVLGCALLPTEVPFIQGRASYKFQADTGFPATLSPFVTGIGGHDFLLFQNDSSLALVNGYSQQTVPGVYTDALGLAAYKALVQFTSDPVQYPGWVGIDQFSSWTKKDVSAFAVSFLQLGQSPNGVGSPLTEIDFEVPINAPIFSVFANYSQNSLTRYFRHARPFAGDANYLGYTITHAVTKREQKSKIIPKFKQLDFYEYMEVFSLYLGKALQKWYTNTTQIQLAPSTPPVWPLTWQDTAILLRQAIGSCLSPEVLAGQFMAVESAQSTVQFVPFLWSTNCRPSNTISGLMLPVVFLEGIRCMQGVCTEVEYELNGVTRKGGRAVIYPILGVYSFDVPTVQYEYESSEGVFSPVYTVLPQTGISLIDGYSAIPNQATNINSGQLNTNLMIWNEYMTNLKSNSCQLESLGSDKPPRSLHSIHLTNVCSNYPTDGRKKVERPKMIGAASRAHSAVRIKREVTMVKGDDEKMTPVVMIDPYSVVGPLQVTSQSQILKPVWSNWQNMIVLPTIRIAVATNDDLTPTSYFDYSVALNEPFSLNQSIGDGITEGTPIELLSQRHDRFASECVRNVMSQQTSLEQFLSSEIEKGRGGSLGSMLGGLAGSFLEKWIPGASQIGASLGSLVPV